MIRGESESHSFSIALKEHLPRARQHFLDRGFSLPSVFLAAVESARQRAGKERDYQGFLDEVAFESCTLKFPWQPSVRGDLRPADRSEYLDSLIDDERQPDRPRKSPDPNFDLFVRTKSEEWQALLERFRQAKVQDQERVMAASGLQSLLANVSQHRTVVSVLKSVAGQHGYELIRENKQELICENQALLASKLTLVDLPALEKRGLVIVQYSFPRHSPAVFGLDSFVAGAYLYSQGNKDRVSLAFSFYVQCAFLFDLATELQRGGV